jgi:hypothetical protein
VTFDSDHTTLDSRGRNMYVADFSAIVTPEVVDEGVYQSSLLDEDPLYLSHVASSVSEPDVLLDESSTIYVISLGREYIPSLPCSTSYHPVVLDSTLSSSLRLPFTYLLTSTPYRHILCASIVDPLQFFTPTHVSSSVIDGVPSLHLFVDTCVVHDHFHFFRRTIDPVSYPVTDRASTCHSCSVIISSSSSSFRVSSSHLLHQHTTTNTTITISSPAPMDDNKKTSNMQARRLTNQSESSPFGLWTSADPLDGPSSARCYAPYGEPLPSTTPQPEAVQAAVRSSVENEARRSEGFKPWEKGSKTGKKIKPDRGPKGRTAESQESSVGDNDMVSSSNSSNHNDGNTGSSTPVTPALPSSRPPPVPASVLDPRIAPIDQEQPRARIRLLPPSAPDHGYPAGSAQAAIAELRSTTIHSTFLTSTDTG